MSSEDLLLRRNNESKMMEQWVQALCVKDVDRIMSHYASDIVLFDLAPPLQYKGTNVYTENWQAWFPTKARQVRRYR